ncbi:MAG: methyltransferase domain-containing protein [Paludibacteraceae bacterium]
MRCYDRRKRTVNAGSISSSTLVHCEAESLPFEDASFDVVFHCGELNYYNDKQKAITEMIRVTKPGTKILIVDETDKLVKENYQKNPKLKGALCRCSQSYPSYQFNSERDAECPFGDCM